jgi:hypothetical protein
VLEAAWRIELATREVLDEGVAEDAVPAIEVGQPLRSLTQLGEEADDAQEGAPGAMMLAVRAGDGDRGLSAKLELPALPGRTILQTPTSGKAPPDPLGHDV